MANKVTYQFTLFGFQRPINKVPISAERIREVQGILEEKNGKLKQHLTPTDSKRAELLLRNVRDGLENYLHRLK